MTPQTLSEILEERRILLTDPFIEQAIEDILLEANMKNVDRLQAVVGDELVESVAHLLVSVQGLATQAQVREQAAQGVASLIHLARTHIGHQTREEADAALTGVRNYRDELARDEADDLAYQAFRDQQAS